MGFWSAVGKTLASTAKVTAKGAVWASQHPEVLQQVVSIAAVAQTAQGAAKKSD